MIRFVKVSVYTLISICLGSCVTVHTVRTGVPITPIHQVNPERFVLLNTYDVAAEKYRTNKEQFFMVLLDKALLDMSRDIQKRTGLDAPAKLGLTSAGTSSSVRDSVVMNIMMEHQASDAIVITSFTVYFEQTDVVVTRDDDGSKNREAHYDIISNIRYLWYDREGLFRDEEIDVRRFHSTRSVLSGLLAAGPNVVKQQDDVYSIVEENTIRYLNLFLPGVDFRMRPVFTGKEFTVFKHAIDANDYERALGEALRLVDAPDRKVAAKANYNAAVMYERLEHYHKVKQYLLESAKLYRYEFTNMMLEDY